MAFIVLPGSPGKRNQTIGKQTADRPLPMLNMSEKLLVYPYYRWTRSFTLPPLKWEADARLWSSVLHQLVHLNNYCTLAPPAYSGPSTGYVGGGPLVKGAGQGGIMLACDNVTPSTTVARQGDYLSFVTEMHGLAADAVSDGAGNVTFHLTEPIRFSPPDNTAVELNVPVARFRLVNPENEFSTDHLRRFGISAQFVETY